MTGGQNRIGLVLAGPTADYGYTSFGKDVTTQGYVSENPVPTAKCSNDGTCTYTFAHAIPAAATATPPKPKIAAIMATIRKTSAQ